VRLDGCEYFAFVRLARTISFNDDFGGLIEPDAILREGGACGGNARERTSGHTL
jgi:hypothetical protein